MGAGTGIGDGIGEGMGATVGTGVGEVGGDAVGVGEPLDGEEQAAVISSEVDAAIRINVTFMRSSSPIPPTPVMRDRDRSC